MHRKSSVPPNPSLRESGGRHQNAKHFSHWLGVELSEVSTKEKLIAGLGGFVSILLLLIVSGSALGSQHAYGFIVSMGASAVLLFAVPHGQLSQPWPVIAGHGFSALIGVTCAGFIDSPCIAAACAVGISITVMHQFKCIHPPGGATALTAVMGGETVRRIGFGFVIHPVLSNALLIVSIAVVFNLSFKWRRYPAALSRTIKVTSDRPDLSLPSHERVVEAVRSLDSFVDITEDDLVKLVRLLVPAMRWAPSEASHTKDPSERMPDPRQGD